MAEQTGKENVLQKRAFNFGVCLGLRNLRLVYIRDDIYLKLEQAAEKRRQSIETLTSQAVSRAIESYVDDFEDLFDIER